MKILQKFLENAFQKLFNFIEIDLLNYNEIYRNHFQYLLWSDIMIDKQKIKFSSITICSLIQSSVLFILKGFPIKKNKKNTQILDVNTYPEFLMLG